MEKNGEVRTNQTPCDHCPNPATYIGNGAARCDVHGPGSTVGDDGGGVTKRGDVPTTPAGSLKAFAGSLEA